MPDIDVGQLSPSAQDATDCLLVRRGTDPFSMALTKNLPGLFNGPVFPGFFGSTSCRTATNYNTLAGVDEGEAVDAETLGCDWITGQVSRVDGALHLTLILPHGADAPQAALFPDPIDAGDGPVALPGQEGAGNDAE